MKPYEKKLECWQCLRCDHLWPKKPGDRPVNCPACHNRLWATSYRRKVNKKVVQSRAIPREADFSVGEKKDLTKKESSITLDSVMTTSTVKCENINPDRRNADGGISYSPVAVEGRESGALPGQFFLEGGK